MKVIFVAPKANIPQELIKKLEKEAKIYFFEDNPIDIRQIEELKKPGEKILCPFPEPISWKFPNEFIKEIPDLKSICLSTTSFSWIDGKLARSLGIDLTNVPNPPNGVAEEAIFAMLGIAKKYAVSFKEKMFDFVPTNFLQEISGKTMGIIGLGKIGSRLAELGKVLGMEVIYWSQKTRKDSFEYVALDKLFKTADFIFPTMSLNEETKGFVSAKLIDLMKPSSSFVATVNSELVDMNYLLDRVKKKEIFGCALASKEKTMNDYEGNVFVVFGNGWYTKETVEKKMRIWIENIIGIIKGKPLNLVN